VRCFAVQVWGAVLFIAFAARRKEKWPALPVVSVLLSPGTASPFSPVKTEQNKNKGQKRQNRKRDVLFNSGKRVIRLTFISCGEVQENILPKNGKCFVLGAGLSGSAVHSAG
jgi:hypothetical protein